METRDVKKDLEKYNQELNYSYYISYITKGDEKGFLSTICGQ